MGFGAPPIGIRPREIDGAAEMQTSIGVEVDVERFEVGGGVDDADVARLDEVIGHDEVFLVRGDFDVVRADGGLDFVGVVEAFDVGEVGDVERGDVVCGC